MIPYVREINFEYGACDQVSPLIRRVIARNPGPFTYTGTGTYIIGRGEVAVIDPGPDLPEHLEALKAAIGQERVTHIVITHHHSDHWPLAEPLKAWSGAAIYGHPPVGLVEADESGLTLDEDSRRDFHPDRPLTGGERLQGPGWTLEAVATPGHCADHLCYALKEENALFTGDHIMGWSTTVIVPPDGDMSDYMQSLQTVRDGGYATLWPTHGPPVREVAPFVDAYAEHRRDRERQILDALAAGPARIGELVPRLYADVDPRLHPAAARSMFASMIDLVRRGRVATDGAPQATGVYRLA